MRNLSNISLRDHLMGLAACHDSLNWIAGRDLKTAWAECPRGDWLFWLAGRSKKLPRKTLVLAACACARTALKFVPANEKRPLVAIETAEKWARGKATLPAVSRAADAAYAAANAAYAAAYAANPAVAATNAANAATTAADAYYAAYAAANAAAYAAANAAADVANARRQAQLECANIVRGFFSYTDL